MDQAGVLPKAMPAKIRNRHSPARGCKLLVHGSQTTRPGPWSVAHRSPATHRPIGSQCHQRQPDCTGFSNRRPIVAPAVPEVHDNKTGPPLARHNPKAKAAIRSSRTECSRRPVVQHPPVRVPQACLRPLGERTACSRTRLEPLQENLPCQARLARPSPTPFRLRSGASGQALAAGRNLALPSSHSAPDPSLQPSRTPQKRGRFNQENRPEWQPQKPVTAGTKPADWSRHTSPDPSPRSPLSNSELLHGANRPLRELGEAHDCLKKSHALSEFPRKAGSEVLNVGQLRNLGYQSSTSFSTIGRSALVTALVTSDCS